MTSRGADLHILKRLISQEQGIALSTNKTSALRHSYLNVELKVTGEIVLHKMEKYLKAVPEEESKFKQNHKKNFRRVLSELLNRFELGKKPKSNQGNQGNKGNQGNQGNLGNQEPHFSESTYQDVLVSGLPPRISEKKIKKYFEGKAKGKGIVECKLFDKHQNRAVITLKDFEDTEISRIITQDHTLEKSNLSLTKYASKTFSFPLDASVRGVIDEALPRLANSLAKVNALCAKDNSHENLVIVCLKATSENISPMVFRFLEEFKQQEISKRYRTEKIKTVDEKTLLFLNQIGFIAEMKSMYAGMKISTDFNNVEISLTGSDAQLEDAQAEYAKIVSGIDELRLELGESIIGILPNRFWEEYNKKLASEGIKAQISFDELDKSLAIVGLTSDERDKARDSLFESLKQENVSLPEDAIDLVKSEKFETFVRNLKSKNLLSIQVDTSEGVIKLAGTEESTFRAKKEMEDFILVERIQSHSFKVTQTAGRYLTRHFSSTVKPVEYELKAYHVSVRIHPVTQTEGETKVEVKGTLEGLAKTKEQLQRLCQAIVEKKESLVTTGLPLSDKHGKEQMKLIEIEQKVVITFHSSKQGGKGKQNEPVAQPNTSPTPTNSPVQGSVYDRCNFTTSEGIQVSWKYGRIESVQADVLVSSAHSDLNNLTACGKAMNAVGGTSFTEACKPHTNIPLGGIQCTNGGNLPCKFVIHAVCCTWDVRKADKSKKLLRDLVKKILDKCIELDVSSVAMPTIGTGEHRFSEKIVLTIFEEEIKRMSASNLSNVKLRNIQIVVFDADKRTPTAAAAANLPAAHSQTPHSSSSSSGLPTPQAPPFFPIPPPPIVRNPVPSVCGSVDSASPQVTFQSVRVFLSQGDLTLYKASAIINVLSEDFKLISGGGVSKSILKAGGEIIQQKLDSFVGKIQPGQMMVTTAGSMKNVDKILHFIPITTSASGLQNSLQMCFESAKRLSVDSVSIPAIGTASFKIDATSSANLILNAAKEFSETGEQLDVHIVVFQKTMVPEFEMAMKERAKGNIVVTQSKQKSSLGSPNKEADAATLPAAHSQTPHLSSSSSSLPTLQAPPFFPIPPPPIVGNPVPSACGSVDSASPQVTFQSVRVFLSQGDLTLYKASAIINVLSKDFKLINGGGVSKSILKVGGEIIQQKLDSFVDKIQPGQVMVTTAGLMKNVDRILHFIPITTNASGLQNSLKMCFEFAKRLSVDSVSIPAIGTASFKIDAKSSANLILNAAKKFSETGEQLDVHIVVFQKTMVPEFEIVIKEKAKECASVTQSQRKSSLGSPRKEVQVQNSSNQPELLSIGEKQETRFHIIGRSTKNIEKSFERVKKFIEQNTATKKIQHQRVCEVVNKHRQEVEHLSAQYDVFIECYSSAEEASIQGMVRNVSDCKDELTKLVNKYDEEEREMEKLHHISQYVQWSYTDGSRLVDYDKQLNGTIEQAFNKDKQQLWLVFKGGVQFEIDFTTMTEKNRQNGQVVRITRSLHGSNASDLPSDWDPQPEGKVVHLVSLPPLSAEYQTVLELITSKGGTHSQIISIERIQNPGLYQAYLAKKKAMHGQENEMKLFHGTDAKNTPSINSNNFNRGFAGINGVKYGNGVYFSSDAAYSMHYARPQSPTGNAGHSQMYVAKVLVGKYTAGKYGMKAPPPRNDSNNPDWWYDSVVDNIQNPSIFVIFLDHQCYPEYLITFV